MVNADPRPLQSAVYEGWVRHRRSVPRAHAFRYRMYMLYLDLAELDRVFADRWLWSVGRRNLVEFRRSDYHGDPSIALDMAIRDTVEKRSGGAAQRTHPHARAPAHLRPLFQSGVFLLRLRGGRRDAGMDGTVAPPWPVGYGLFTR